MKHRIRTFAFALFFGATAGCGAGNSLAQDSVRVKANDPCLKNHYILSDDCRTSAADVAIGAPGAMTTDARGNVYFSSPNLVFKLDRRGGLSRVAGNVTAGFAGDGGPATEALLNFGTYPEFQQDYVDFQEFIAGLAVDAVGNLFIADSYNNRVRKVDTDGIISTFAGDGTRETYPSFAGVPGVQALDAQISWPQGMAFDPAGNLYVVSQWGPLFRITPDGIVDPLVTGGCVPSSGRSFCMPEGIAVDADANVYVVDSTPWVKKFLHEGVSSVEGTMATVPARAVFNNATRLLGPYGVALDRSGNVFVAETYNHCVREIDAAGETITVAGVCGKQGFDGDGGAATSALLSAPHGLTIDADGNLWIADTGNRRIRKVYADGVIATVAGNGKNF